MPMPNDEHPTPRRGEEKVSPLRPLPEAGEPKGVPAPKLAPATPKPGGEHFASIFPGPDQPVPVELVETVRALEASVAMEVWLLVHQGEANHPLDYLTEEICQAFFAARATMPKNRPICLLLDSPGGSADAAYRLARLLRNQCGSFTVAIPRYAKSAATLLALGADRILMHPYAEMGPLDAQLEDPDREDFSSALNEVQSLERLHASALVMVDSTMRLLLPRTRKRVDTLLPVTLKFVSDMTRPLFEKLDTVHVSKMSRLLKVGEEYAIRLLQPRYRREEAEVIARALVHSYPDHGFVIDRQEAEGLNLATQEPTPEQEAILDKIIPLLSDATLIGRLEGKA